MKHFFKSLVLNKKRSILVVVLVSCLAAWQTAILPNLLGFGRNFSFKSNVQSHDNFFDPVTNSYQGDQTSVTSFGYRALKKQGDTLQVVNSFDVRKLNGEPIFKVVRNYAINAKSGRHVPGGDHDRQGYMFAPRMRGLSRQAKDKTSFTYWHVNYDQPANMQYQSSEVLDGLPVYKYQAKISADQTKELTNTSTGVGYDKGVTLDVVLQLWVEPYTGRIVKYRDDTVANYYNLVTKEKLYPWNKFYNQTANESVAQLSQTTTVLKGRFVLFEYVVPAFLLLLIIIVISRPLWTGFLDRFLANDRKRSLVPQTLISITIVVFATVVAVLTQNSSTQHKTSEFSVASHEVVNAITDRIESYNGALRGGQGFFEQSDVTRSEWKNYVQALDMTRQYPGIQGFGFGRLVRPETLNSYLQQTKAQGQSGFSISPTGVREIMVPVTFIEPVNDRNNRALGFDMWTEQSRRAAMTYARDNDEPGISGLVKLKQEDVSDLQPGFLIYQPIYRPQAVGTIKERQANLYGFVYGAFRAKDLMQSIFTDKPTSLGVRVYDTDSPSSLSSTNLLFQTNNIAKSSLSKIITTKVYNRTWTIVLVAPADNSNGFARNSLPLLIEGFGFVVAALVFILVRTINLRRLDAIKLAQNMTADLKKSNSELELAVNTADQKLHETEKLNQFMVDRELKMIELKSEIKALKAKHGKSK